MPELGKTMQIISFLNEINKVGTGPKSPQQCLQIRAPPHKRVIFLRASAQDEASSNRASVGLIWVRPETGEALYGHRIPHTHAPWHKLKRKVPLPPSL